MPYLGNGDHLPPTGEEQKDALPDILFLPLFCGERTCPDQKDQAQKTKKPHPTVEACTPFHSWHPTFVLGQFLCTVCGIYAYCPGCTPINPHQYAHLHYCTKHQVPKGDES
jgi:hypothetical protein